MSILGIIDAMRSDYPPTVRLFWMCLENHANGIRQWSITNAEAARELHLHENSISNAADILEADEIIRIDRRHRRKTTYTLLRSYDHGKLAHKNCDSNVVSLVTKNVGQPHKICDPSADLGHSKCAPNPQVRIHNKNPPGVRAAQSSSGLFDDPPARQSRRSSAPLTTLDPAWQPNERDFDYAKKCGYDREAATKILERFRLHHLSKGTKLLNWDFAAQYWLRNEEKMSPPPRGSRTNGGSSSRMWGVP